MMGFDMVLMTPTISASGWMMMQGVCTDRVCARGVPRCQKQLVAI
jgi:hypothetical protein